MGFATVTMATKAFCYSACPSRRPCGAKPQAMQRKNSMTILLAQEKEYPSCPLTARCRSGRTDIPQPRPVSLRISKFSGFKQRAAIPVIDLASGRSRRRHIGQKTMFPPAAGRVPPADCAALRCRSDTNRQQPEQDAGLQECPSKRRTGTFFRSRHRFRRLLFQPRRGLHSPGRERSRSWLHCRTVLRAVCTEQFPVFDRRAAFDASGHIQYVSLSFSFLNSIANFAE